MDEKITLWQPIFVQKGCAKDKKRTYKAVLSDDSLDRDGERVGKMAIQKVGNQVAATTALFDHENKAMNMIGKWINKSVETIDGKNAFTAELKFFKSNPNAVILQNMLDEGAEFGVSIGARVLEHEEIDGVKTFTDLDLYEASIVAIPANQNGRIMAVAKIFNKQTGVDKKMSDEKIFKQADIDAEVEKTAEVSKKFDELEKSNTELKKQFDDLQKKVTDLEVEKTKVEEEFKSYKESAVQKAINDTPEPGADPVEKTLADAKEKGWMPCY